MLMHRKTICRDVMQKYRRTHDGREGSDLPGFEQQLVPPLGNLFPFQIFKVQEVNESLYWGKDHECGFLSFARMGARFDCGDYYDRL